LKIVITAESDATLDLWRRELSDDLPSSWASRSADVPADAVAVSGIFAFGRYGGRPKPGVAQILRNHRNDGYPALVVAHRPGRQRSAQTHPHRPARVRRREPGILRVSAHSPHSPHGRRGRGATRSRTPLPTHAAGHGLRRRRIHARLGRARRCGTCSGSERTAAKANRREPHGLPAIGVQATVGRPDRPSVGPTGLDALGHDPTTTRTNSRGFHVLPDTRRPPLGGLRARAHRESTALI